MHRAAADRLAAVVAAERDRIVAVARCARRSNRACSAGSRRRRNPRAAATTARHRRRRPRTLLRRAGRRACRRRRRCRRWRNRPARPRRYSRIGTQPPARNTSGARPSLPRGVGVRVIRHGRSPRRRVLVAGLRLGRLPRIAAVEVHAHIAARARRAAEADLAPRRRMARNRPCTISGSRRLAKNSARGMPPQAACVELALLRRCSSVLLGGVERVKAQRRAPLAPPHRAPRGRAATLRASAAAAVAVAVAAVLDSSLCVDHARRSGPAGGRRLRHDAIAHRVERLPFRVGEEARLARHAPGAVDHAPGLLVPRGVWRLASTS